MYMFYFCSCIAGYHKDYKYCTLEPTDILTTVFAIWSLEYCNNQVALRAENGTQANNM